MKSRHILCQAYLHTLAFALLMLGTVGLAAYLVAAEPSLHSLLLLPDAALLALVSGLLVLAVARRQRLLLLGSGGLLVGLCLYSLGHSYLAGGDDQGLSLVSQFLRVRSATAAGFLLLAGGYLAGWSRHRSARRFARLAGLLLMMLAVVSQALAWSWPLPALQLGYKPDSNAVAAVVLLLGGLGILLLGQLPRLQPRLLDRLSLAIAAFGTACTLLGWFYAGQQQVRERLGESAAVLDQAELQLRLGLDERLALLQRMADRWQALGRLPAEDFWAQESRSYLRDVSGFEAIAVLDAQLRPHWLVGLHESEADWVRSFAADPAGRDWLRERQAGAARVELGPLQGAPGLGTRGLLALPLQLPQQRGWLLVASLNPQALLQTLDVSGRSIGLEVVEYGAPIIAPQATAASLPPLQHRHFKVGPYSEWELNTRLRLDAASHSALPLLVLLFGLVSSFLLVISQRLGWVAVQHARSLQDSLVRQERVQAQNQRIMEYSLDVLCSFDQEGRFTQVNRACERVFGYRPDELIGRRHDELVVPADREATRLAAAAVVAGRPTRLFRNRVLHRDGRIVEVLWSADWSEQDHTLFAVARDITELVVQERRYELQRRVLEMISTDAPLDEVLAFICLMVEELDPGALCSVLLLDAKGEHLSGGVAPSLPAAYSARIDGTAVGPQAGSCGTAAYRRERVVVADIDRDPLWQDYRELAAEHDLRACWSQPLLANDGRVLGTFAVYERQVGAPDEEQLRLMGDAAYLAGIAIERYLDRQQLDESRQRYGSLFSNNPDLVFSFDREGRFQSVNPAVLSATGLSEAQFIGRHWNRLLDAADHVRVGQHFAAALQGQQQRYEVGIRGPGGEPRMLDVSNVPIIVDGEIVGVFGIGKDITERQQMMRALHERDQFFKLSLEPFCLVDLQGNFVQVNPAFTQLLLYPEEVLLGKPYMSLVHVEDRPRIEQAIARMLDGELVRDLFLRALDAGGNQRWLHISAVMDAQHLIYCAARDITEQRQASERDRQNSLLMSMTGKLARLGGWSLELPEQRLLWSAELAELMGHPEAADFGVVREIQLDVSLINRELRSAIDRCIETGAAFDLDLQVRTFDLRLLDVRAIGQALCDEQGQVHRVVGALQDIGERRQAQRALQTLADRLSTTLESITDAFFTVDPLWRFNYANQEASLQLGFAREELLGQDMWTLFPGLAESEAGERYRRALQEQQPAHFETFYEPLQRWFEIHAYPSDEGLAVYFRDVGERKRSEAALRHREETLRKLLDDTRDALLVIDPQQRLRYANPAALRLFEQSSGQMPEHLELPEHREELFEWTLPDGRHAVEIHRSQTEWEGQTVDLLSLRDITERKAALTELRLLKRSLESSNNGVVIADARLPDMPIIYINPAFERITGYRAEEVLGRNCRFLQGSERDDLQVQEIRQGLQQQRDVRAVLRNYRKDGSLFWNDLYISPVFDDDGQLTHFIGIQTDISEQKRYENELSHNASHDLLTGLPNRALLEDRLTQGCRIARRYERMLAVLFIDLDGFKPINDSFGHAFGDQLLAQTAQRMLQEVRPGDTVARMGGDEFIILLPDLAREADVLQVAERLIEAIGRPFIIQGIDLHVTASIGITLSDGNLEQPMQLIQQADLAMYKAKEEGRNNYQWYTSDLNQRVSERVSLRNDLQKAIDNQDFELYYQPQIDARSGRMVGMEALLRWKHAQRGFVSPAEFIPVAEDTGQIIPLSTWVLDRACADTRRLAEQGMSGFVTAVNISPMQFQRAGFVEQVHAMLERHQLEPRWLELEITESVLLNNAERAIQTLHQLKELGVEIAVDDFGTGFSSLSYLKRLPIDKVKIDRTFIQDVISDSNDAAITQGIISMAHHLKLKVIAEGVETEPQFAFLRKSHCDSFQGYYFAKPMPFEALQHFLRERLLTQEPAPALLAGDAPPQTLLLLDDEENILRALARVLRRDGYKILMATRAQDAFELLAKHEVQVILSDQRMPEMNGTEFLSRVKDLYPDTIRIVLSGYTDLKSVTDAINQGAIYKFFTKPWDDEQLRQNIAEAFRSHRQGRQCDGGET